MLAVVCGGAEARQAHDEEAHRRAALPQHQVRGIWRVHRILIIITISIITTSMAVCWPRWAWHYLTSSLSVLCPRLLLRVSRSADSHLRQLYYHNGLSAICSSLSTAVGEMAAVDDTGRR